MNKNSKAEKILRENIAQGGETPADHLVRRYEISEHASLNVDQRLVSPPRIDEATRPAIDGMKWTLQDAECSTESVHEVSKVSIHEVI